MSSFRQATACCSSGDRSTAGLTPGVAARRFMTDGKPEAARQEKIRRRAAARGGRRGGGEVHTRPPDSRRGRTPRRGRQAASRRDPRDRQGKGRPLAGDEDRPAAIQDVLTPRYSSGRQSLFRKYSRQLSGSEWSAL